MSIALELPPDYTQEATNNTITNGTTPELPGYTRASNDQVVPAPSIPPPAPYQRRRTEHIRRVGSPTKPWAILRIYSNALRPDQLPAFLEDEDLSGKVTLHLKSERIKCVTAKLTGNIITGPAETATFGFLTQKYTLWAPEMGMPEPIGAYRPDGETPEDHHLNNHGEDKTSYKLSGSYEWPFSFKFPRQLVLQDEDTPASDVIDPATGPFILPPTFMAKGSSIAIQYMFEVAIKKTFLRPDAKLETMVAYVPATRPPPYTDLRLLSYRDGTPLVGPDVDPDGWHILPPITLDGMYQERKVVLTNTLAIGKPLAYTRGTPIPLILKLTSIDREALTSLSSPTSTQVRFLRVVSSRPESQVPPMPPESTFQPPTFQMSKNEDLNMVYQNYYDGNYQVGGDNSNRNPKKIVSSNRLVKGPGLGGPGDNITFEETAKWWFPHDHGGEDGDDNAGRIPQIENGMFERTIHGQIMTSPLTKASARMGFFSVQYFVVVFPPEFRGFTPKSAKSITCYPVEIMTMHAKGMPRPTNYAPC